MDHETRFEEKVHQMLTLLNQCNFKDTVVAEIEDKIYMDHFINIEDFKIALKRYKKDLNNYKGK